MIFIVYILQSEVDESYYVGYTSDINKRLIDHNSKSAYYTSRKIPWRIVYTEFFESKTDAIKREIFIKKQKSKVFIKSLIDSKA